MQQEALLEPMADEPLAMSGDVLAVIADSVICTDENGRILLFNRAAEQAFGYSASEVIGQPVEMLIPQRHRADHAEQVRGFASGEGGASRIMGHLREVRGQRKNGEEFPAEATVSRQTIDGRTILTVVHRDISERKAIEQQREAIARELDHRIRNVLSVVNSIVSITARSAATTEDFRESLLERLGALARTQAALGFGAQQKTSLGDLLLDELAQYKDAKGANIRIEGPPVLVGSRAAQTLALTFHELATNSAKYGALSAPTGSIFVNFSFVGDGDSSQVLIEWRESGGPPVEPPSRQGFGTTLIKQIVERTFRAAVVLEYPREGLVCRMSLPTLAVEAALRV